MTDLDHIGQAFFLLHPRSRWQRALEKLSAGVLSLAYVPLQIVMLLIVFMALCAIGFAVLRLVAHLSPGWPTACLAAATMFAFMVAFRSLANVPTLFDVWFVRVLQRGFRRWEDLSNAQPNALVTGMMLRLKIETAKAQEQKKNVNGLAERLASALRSRIATKAGATSANSTQHACGASSEKLQQCSASRWNTSPIWLRLLAYSLTGARLLGRHAIVVDMALATILLLHVDLGIANAQTLGEALGRLLVGISVALGLVRGVRKNLIGKGHSAHHFLRPEALIGALGILLVSPQLRVLLDILRPILVTPVVAVTLCAALAAAYVWINQLSFITKLIVFALQLGAVTVIVWRSPPDIAELTQAFDASPADGAFRLIALMAAPALYAKPLKELLKEAKEGCNKLHNDAMAWLHDWTMSERTWK